MSMLAEPPGAERMSGLALPGGWTVGERIVALPGATGGHFSQGYFVKRNDGREGFLKALDYSSALMLPDPAPVLNAMTEAYLFERDLYNECSEKNLDHVVRVLGSGATVVAGVRPETVQYLIFELADGDIRARHDPSSGFELRMVLRSLAVSTGQRNSLGELLRW